MTTLIQQLSGNDCALASIAMARGAASWHDVWTKADLDAIIASQGMRWPHRDEWMAKAGYAKDSWRQIEVDRSADQSLVRQLLWKRRALLSVSSLNNDGGSHMVYWDGSALFDPSTQRTYAFLSSLTISQVLLFDDGAPS